MTLPELQRCYYELLAIPLDEQPADHYRLLGLRRFESNLVVIKNAADCRMAFVQNAPGALYLAASQQLLNHLAEAMLCLLNEGHRASYDEMLRAEEAAKAPLVEPSAPPSSPGEERPHPPTKAEREESIVTKPASNTDRVHGPAPGKRSVADRCWVIGSGDDCDIVVANPYVSKRHCRLLSLDGRFVLEDTDSRNGTYVNGVKISQPTMVDPRDKITLGRQTSLRWPL